MVRNTNVFISSLSQRGLMIKRFFFLASWFDHEWQLINYHSRPHSFGSPKTGGYFVQVIAPVSHYQHSKRDQDLRI